MPSRNDNPSSWDAVSTSSSDLWLLQHLHRNAILDGGEREAQSAVLQAFWSKLRNYTILEANYHELQKSHIELAATSVERDRLISELRAQAVQATIERDLAESLDTISEAVISMIENSEDKLATSRLAGAKARQALADSRLYCVQAERINSRLEQELSVSRDETVQALEQFETLRWQSESLLESKDAEIQELSASLQRLQATSRTRTGKKRRHRQKRQA